MRAAAVLLLGFASARAADGPAELQGRWELVSLESEGRDYPYKDNRPRLEIVGDRVRYGGQDLALVAADSGSSPKWVDLRFEPSKRIFEGIYTRERETLKVCLNRRTEGVRERPDALATRGHDSWRLLTFRRAMGEGSDPGFVGLALGVDEATKGVVVDDLLEGTPAAKSGLKKGDVVLSVGGADVTDLASTIRAVRAGKPGETLAFRIRRDGEPREIKVRVAVMPFTLVADLD